MNGLVASINTSSAVCNIRIVNYSDREYSSIPLVFGIRFVNEIRQIPPNPSQTHNNLSDIEFKMKNYRCISLYRVLIVSIYIQN